VEKAEKPEKDKEKEDGESKEGDGKEGEAKEGEGEDKKEGEEGEDEEPPKLIDVNTVQDVNDMGNGEPLYANFMFEDWALMSLRLELHLLVKAFTHDVDDAERPGIHESHLSFYYSKYYKKQLNTKFFGMNDNIGLVDMIKDTVNFSEEDKILHTVLTEDVEKSFNVFVKLTEECRRERQRRIDAGDETAKLRFSVLAASTPAAKSTAAGGATAKSGFQGNPNWQAGQKWQPRPQSWSGGGNYRPAGQQSWRPKYPGGKGW